ncbi:unnamed protein product, partial [Prorocentrum cordatum]
PARHGASASWAAVAAAAAAPGGARPGDAAPAQSLSISPLQIAGLPLLRFGGRVVVVGSEEDEARVQPLFAAEDLLGFDSESRPSTALAPRNPPGASLSSSSPRSARCAFGGSGSWAGRPRCCGGCWRTPLWSRWGRAPRTRCRRSATSWAWRPSLSSTCTTFSGRNTTQTAGVSNKNRNGGIFE